MMKLTIQHPGADGCPPLIHNNGTFDAKIFQKVEATVRGEILVTFANTSLLIYTYILLVFTGTMPTVLTFPSEVQAVCKETFNNWYGCSTYYLAKTLSEIPFMLIFPTIFVGLCYYGNEQPTDQFWRMPAYVGIAILLSLVAQAQGSLISVVFIDNPAAGVYASPVSMVPSIILCGFFIRVNDMKDAFVVLSYSSCLRFAFEAGLIVIYGYERCGTDITQMFKSVQASLRKWMMSMMGLSELYNQAQLGHVDVGGMGGMAPTHVMANTSLSAGVAFDPLKAATKFSNGIVNQMIGKYVGDDGQVRSRVLNEFGLREEDLWPNLCMLLAMFFLFRILTYVLLYRRIYLKI